jgi:hypothetical protein
LIEKRGDREGLIVRAIRIGDCISENLIILNRPIIIVIKNHGDVMIGRREKPFTTSDVETRVLDTASDKVNRRSAVGLHLA